MSTKSFTLRTLGLLLAAIAITPVMAAAAWPEKPGALNYASSGIGGFPHMNTELFKLKTGVNVVHVPFRGGGPAIADVMTGHTQMYLGTLVTVMPQITSGRLKLSAVISETVPGYETYIWWGIFAPNGTPPAVIARLHADTTAALGSPGFIKRLDEQGGAPVKMSSAEFGRLMVSETVKWTEVIKAAGIKGE